MVGLVALAALGLAQGTIKATNLTRDAEPFVTARVAVTMDPLDPPRYSPKSFGSPPQPWIFPWLTTGFVHTGQQGLLAARFRVYSQERKASNDDAELVTRMLTGLWKQNRERLKLDHAPRYNGGLVDIFLCWGGKAGGEQRFDVVIERTESRQVNTIYFYDLKSFTDPVEKAREVAHEYGHASLPPIGGFEAPEGWANGYLGEKLFLKWMAELLQSGKYTSEDAMGAGLAQLEEWVKKNVNPLVVKGGQLQPTARNLNLRTEEGMNRYLGLALFAETILPSNVFARSIQLTGSTFAKDYPQAILLAAEEQEELPLTIPSYLRGKQIWVPVGKGTVSGAKILRFADRWAEIMPTAETVSIKNRR